MKIDTSELGPVHVPLNREDDRSRIEWIMSELSHHLKRMGMQGPFQMQLGSEDFARVMGCSRMGDVPSKTTNGRAVVSLGNITIALAE